MPDSEGATKKKKKKSQKRKEPSDKERKNEQSSSAGSVQQELAKAEEQLKAFHGNQNEKMFELHLLETIKAAQV